LFIRSALAKLLNEIAEPHKLAVLLPEVPRPDLIEFLHSNSIVVITTTREGRFDVAPLPRMLEGPQQHEWNGVRNGRLRPLGRQQFEPR
jgi:hypothetical protein